MSTVTIGYTTPFLSTLVVVINWSRDVGLSQIDVWCLRLQIWQPERYLHSEVRCWLPVQLNTQLFQTQLLPAVSDCHKLVIIYSSVVSCVTVDTPTLCWRCFVCVKCFFAIEEFSTLLPCIIRAAHDGVDFLPTFQSFYQPWEVPVLPVYLSSY